MRIFIRQRQVYLGMGPLLLITYRSAFASVNKHLNSI